MQLAVLHMSTKLPYSFQRGKFEQVNICLVIFFYFLHKNIFAVADSETQWLFIAISLDSNTLRRWSLEHIFFHIFCFRMVNKRIFLTIPIISWSKFKVDHSGTFFCCRIAKRISQTTPIKLGLILWCQYFFYYFWDSNLCRI